MLATLANLVPQPIKDVILAPIAARENPDRAAERLIRSGIRIAIAATGVFSTYKLLGIFLPSTFSGFVASVALPAAVVWLASMPAGNIMCGLSLLAFGTIALITVLGLEALTLAAITLNVLQAGMCLVYMSVGWFCIHTTDEIKDRGYLEPYITRIAENYRTSLANALFRR